MMFGANNVFQLPWRYARLATGKLLSPVRLFWAMRSDSLPEGQAGRGQQGVVNRDREGGGKKQIHVFRERERERERERVFDSLFRG